MTKKEELSFLYGSNAIFVEELYQKYLENPSFVDCSWRDYFAALHDQKRDIGASWGNRAKVILGSNVTSLLANGKRSSDNVTAIGESYFKAKALIELYRQNGHYLCNLDPLGISNRKDKEPLKMRLEDVGLEEDEDVDLRFEHFGLGITKAKILEDLLEASYASTIGVEFAHLNSLEEKEWLYSEVEKLSISGSLLSEDDKKGLLQHLVEIEGFEQYLHVKFPGAKRFSIEGGESSVLSMIMAIDYASSHDISDVVIGMAHRGRLSTLVKVLSKPYRAVISEFMGTTAFPLDLGIAGDVKYHMGYSSDKVTRSGGAIHLSLLPNPSHLEAVNPVLAGKVRAQQDVIGDKYRRSVLGVIVHGDAAFAGQGVVAESISMSGLEHYNVGGILHLVINNQIGFTANSSDSRSTRYCTEVAKIASAPIFHVNGDDPEAVAFITQIASEYRQKFSRDVVIDVICYRKYGHNEGDEPMYTQSVMYNVIKEKKTTAAIYADRLLKKNIIADTDYLSRKEEFKKFLESEYEEAKNYIPKVQWLEGLWSGYKRPEDIFAKFITGVDISTLKVLGNKLCDYPKEFAINPKLIKLFEHRKNILNDSGDIDWATAEQLAFATLLSENIPVRLSGQDSGRGTFSHRHSVLHSQTDYSKYVPLNNLSDDYAKYEVVDSNLSEYAVLGFEFGYSLVNPKHLVIWEAQFGDFANGAQIIWDQFISASETKWLRMSGLVALLPHGYEGQGPEHSSARLERFLQLCAENNIQVANPTTPASLFHLIRRQMYRDFLKPLIIMSPKSLLRHKMAVSPLNDLGDGTSFTPMIDDSPQYRNAKRIVICSGKVYYDLLEVRNAHNLEVGIIRIEQYYPFDLSYFRSIIGNYNSVSDFVWCQEEPENMGAWGFIRSYLEDAIGKKVTYSGRMASASPSTGYVYEHNKEQEKLVKQALGELK